MFTTVYQLGSDRQLTFSLPPDQAVVAAFELSRGNANSWDWQEPAQHPNYYRSLARHYCGDFSAVHGAGG